MCSGSVAFSSVYYRTVSIKYNRTMVAKVIQLSKQYLCNKKIGFLGFLALLQILYVGIVSFALNPQFRAVEYTLHLPFPCLQRALITGSRKQLIKKVLFASSFFKIVSYFLLAIVKRSFGG